MAPAGPPVTHGPTVTTRPATEQPSVTPAATLGPTPNVGGDAPSDRSRQAVKDYIYRVRVDRADMYRAGDDARLRDPRPAALDFGSHQSSGCRLGIDTARQVGLLFRS